MVSITQPANLDDLLKYEVHPGFCRDIITLNNGDIALVAGDKLVGKLAWWTGSAWKILDDGDSISATSIICPILYDRMLLAGAAGDAAAFLTDVPILRRGPALVHNDGLDFDADVVQATAKSAMLALGIRVVDEVGESFSV